MTGNRPGGAGSPSQAALPCAYDVAASRALTMSRPAVRIHDRGAWRLHSRRVSPCGQPHHDRVVDWGPPAARIHRMIMENPLPRGWAARDVGGPGAAGLPAAD